MSEAVIAPQTIRRELLRCGARQQKSTFVLLWYLFDLYGDGQPFPIVPAALHRAGARLSAQTIWDCELALLAGRFIRPTDGVGRDQYPGPQQPLYAFAGGEP